MGKGGFPPHRGDNFKESGSTKGKGFTSHKNSSKESDPTTGPNILNGVGTNNEPLNFNTPSDGPIPMNIATNDDVQYVDSVNTIEVLSEGPMFERRNDQNNDNSKDKRRRKDDNESSRKSFHRSDDYQSRNRYDRDRDRWDRDRDENKSNNRNNDNGNNNNSNNNMGPGSSSLNPLPPQQNGMPPMNPMMMGLNPMLTNMLNTMNNINMGNNMPMGNPMNMTLIDPSCMMPQFQMLLPRTDDGTYSMKAPPQGPPMLQMVPDAIPGILNNLNTREPLKFSNFTLYPPSPNAPLPSTKERPLGCKTIFVGGLPENATEDHLREMFAKCGEVQTIRLSTKRFAHLRFMSEMSVDMALFFSGYRMKIEDKTDNPNTGRIHIDFAQARDDQYEYECQQRVMLREQRYQERMIAERFRIPSPPPIAKFSEREASLLSDKIKGDETFEEALTIVTIWLERGECNKRNAASFYSLLQCTNSHIRRLMSEKSAIDEEFKVAKQIMITKTNGISCQYDSIEKCFNAASAKKVWDHFSKGQRKNIDSWKKSAMDVKALIPENYDDSDDEQGPKKKKPRLEDNNALKDENDSLKCQLEAYQNEVQIIKFDMQTELDTKDKVLKVTQQALQGLQQQLLDAKKEQSEALSKVSALSRELELLKFKTKVEEVEFVSNTDAPTSSDKNDLTVVGSAVNTNISKKHGKLIGLISIFLHIHPFGASVDYIWSYVQKFEPTVKILEVELILNEYSSIFTQDLSGIGVNMERRWKYTGITLPS